ncbi:recombinase family protein [Candidatus Peregrinibacteria bacterium]|nr:MAG: recombinase family protein [Candidatus Peregrinibacteria bacterium]
MENDAIEIRAKRYCIYIRKSTDDPKKQVRSIEDQLAECLEIAQRMDINVAKEDIIEDSRSARYSGNRPKFDELIKKIRRREVDGLIAWHPDRLARNMKEAGEIIDLLDCKLLVDLRFASHSFVNDYNGKMGLGIAFVLAKQYSDKLGADVSRGLDRALDLGRSAGQFKPGYTRNELTGLYEPDETPSGYGPNLFELVQSAWEMRLNGKSLLEITDHLNANGYRRIIKKGEKAKGNAAQTMTNQKLSNMFRDRFYFGFLEQGGREIDLTQIYDFIPMIEEGEWLLVQGMGNSVEKRAHVHDIPFRGLVVCAGCKMPMTSGISKGNSGYYLRFWCQNKKKLGCENTGTIRAKTIIDAAAAVFDQFSTLGEEDYDAYVEAYKEARREKTALMARELPALKRKLQEHEDTLDGLIAEVLPRRKQLDQHEEKVYLDTRKRLENLIASCKSRVQDMEASMSDQPLDYKNLLNLLKTLSLSLKFATPAVKDQILRNSILHLLVKGKEVTSIRLKEPFASACKSPIIHNGGPGWT